jgi:transcriptional regulator with PAS, ATPase and Fis domain
MALPRGRLNMDEFARTEIVGSSSAVKNKLGFIKKVADSDKNILILGETGTGKDLTAQKIHELSWRRNRPFVAINCAMIPEGLFEAELLGYARGSFTGAVREKPGLFEIAGEGSIFLDEIGDLPFHLQAKLLRVMEEKKCRRLGEIVNRKIRARMIFATNQNLQEEVELGRFRKDLYYRISVVKFCIPPLRERKEDIPLLAGYFLDKENQRTGTAKELTPEALKKLMAYDFPGNIRELENIVERACFISEKDLVMEGDIKLDENPQVSNYKATVNSDSLRETLEKCRWNKTKAAYVLGKSRRQLYRLLEKHRLDDFIRKSHP